MCYRCFWPQPLCWCESLPRITTQTRFVFLMHPKEFKREKAGTGRLTHLSLPHSEIQVGVGFDDHPGVQRIIHDPALFPVLLYPGDPALDATAGDLAPSRLGDRILTCFIVDATWACARKMVKLSPSLQRLPRLRFTASAPSRWLIKQQPDPGCLSTLEAVHEVLLNLTAAGREAYGPPFPLLDVFARLQQIQLDCAADPDRPGYRRRPYTPPAERLAPSGQSRARRNFTGRGAAAPPAP